MRMKVWKGKGRQLNKATFLPQLIPLFDFSEVYKTTFSKIMFLSMQSKIQS